MAVRLKTDRSKKSTVLFRLLMLIFWKPISKLVSCQFFRKLGHSLADWHRFKEECKSLCQFLTFFTKNSVNFSISNQNKHFILTFQSIFMHYTNQITYLEKNYFWPLTSITRRSMIGKWVQILRSFTVRQLTPVA